MERFIKLGEERIAVSEIKSYTTRGDELSIETENDYFTYKKDDIKNYDLVIRYLDDMLTINNCKIDISTLSAIEPKTSLDFTWDDILKGNIFNTPDTELVPITIFNTNTADANKIGKLNVLNHMLKLMKENIKGFDSRTSLFTFGIFVEFDDNGFIKNFNIPEDYWSSKYNLTSAFNYMMIKVVRCLYYAMVYAKVLEDIPEFSWDVEKKIWHANGNLRLDEEEISLIVELISGELFAKLHLTENKQLTLSRGSKEIIDTYFKLEDIYMDNFLKEIPYNILEESNLFAKFIALRSLFCFTINIECGID